MYEHLDTPTNRRSGLSEKAWMAPVSWFDTISAPVGPFANPGDSVIITNDHVFTTPASQGFIKLLSAHNINKMTAKATGQVGSKVIDQKFEVFLPGSYAVLHETVGNAINDAFIVLSKDADCDGGKVYQMGCDCNYAYIEDAEFTTGTVDGQEAKGWKIVFQAYTGALKQYDGVIDEKP